MYTCTLCVTVQKLPDVEKQAYTLRAKQEKATATGPPVTYRRGRMDCTGELLSVCVCVCVYVCVYIPR